MIELINIQALLKVPKGQLNSFGGYKYRSCEDVLEAVKPLLQSNECTLTLTDDIRQIGDRFYVVATATITNKLGDKSVSVTAYAREQESKKGMDAAQVTGACSSYARKYALNGLFLIDDTSDPDTTDNRDDKTPKKTDKKKPEPPKHTADESGNLSVKCTLDAVRSPLPTDKGKVYILACGDEKYMTTDEESAKEAMRYVGCVVEIHYTKTSKGNNAYVGLNFISGDPMPF